MSPPGVGMPLSLRAPGKLPLALQSLSVLFLHWDHHGIWVSPSLPPRLCFHSVLQEVQFGVQTVRLRGPRDAGGPHVTTGSVSEEPKGGRLGVRCGAPGEASQEAARDATLTDEIRDGERLVYRQGEEAPEKGGPRAGERVLGPHTHGP